jgi:hypothetical protein
MTFATRGSQRLPQFENDYNSYNVFFDPDLKLLHWLSLLLNYSIGIMAAQEKNYRMAANRRVASRNVEYLALTLLDATDATRRYTKRLDATQRYTTLLDATRRYSTLLDVTRRYSTILDATRHYSTLLDATRRYS